MLTAPHRLHCRYKDKVTARPPTNCDKMPPKTVQSNKDSVEALLSDLDNLGTAEPSPRPSTSSAKSANQQAPPVAGATDDAQSLLDDLDNLVQRRAPTPRKQQQQQQSGPEQRAKTDLSISAKNEGVNPSPATAAARALEQTPTSDRDAQSDTAPSSTAAASSASAGSGWGSWGSVWSSATKLADQARAEIERRAQSEQARELSQRGWHLTQGVREFVKEAGLEKLGEDLTKVGKRGWTEVINAVAPPISAHEIIQVTLSHDMIGFDGVPDVTFKVLARVMESQQVGRGTDQQLIVNKTPTESEHGPSSSSRSEEDSQQQDMKVVQGYEQGWILAEETLSQLIKDHIPEAPKASSVTVPITYCPVFLRIQPVVSPLPGSSLAPHSTSESTGAAAEDRKYVSFLLSLRDPNNGLSHKTCSQTFPQSWLSQSFEDNPWIEQALLDILEGALGIIGQDYVNGRQSGRSRSIISEAEKTAE